MVDFATFARFSDLTTPLPRSRSSDPSLDLDLVTPSLDLKIHKMWGIQKNAKFDRSEQIVSNVWVTFMTI